MSVPAYRQRRRSGRGGQATGKFYDGGLMKCARCNADVETGERFCGECGQELRETLPSHQTAEKIVFNVTLVNAGERKIRVIKEVCALTGLGLKDAKDLVESAPKPVRDCVSRQEAEEIKAKLEMLGAAVEVN